MRNTGSTVKTRFERTVAKMNRQQRRLKEQRLLQRRADSIKNDGTMTAINILQIIPLYMLATEYGFGNIRLDRFLSRLYTLVEQVSRDNKILDRMCNVLEHDKGIRISFTSGDNRAENVWKSENDKRKVIRGVKKN